MRILGFVQFKPWLALSLVGIATGCAVASDESQLGAAPPPDAEASAVAAAPLQRRLVDRAYPYDLGADAVVCAEWQLVAPSGEVVDVQREWYPMATMNRHLANVGTPQAVAHVDAGFREALRAQRIERIASCDDARAYVRLDQERLGLTDPAELELPEAPAVAAPVEDPTEENADLEDKILNGSAFDHASTVGIETAASKCTGNLIGPSAMLTAAHCIPSNGFIALRAWIQTDSIAQRCISQPGGGACPALGPATVYAQRHPSYDGTARFDQALVIINPGWYAPANSSTRWTRFAANWGLPLVAGLELDPIRIDGYGKDALVGGTQGLGRRGNSIHTIASVNSQGTVFTIKRETSASSAICSGDSGSGPYNTTLLSGGSNLMMGVTSKMDVTLGTQCTAVGAFSYHSIPDSAWIQNLVTFFGGSCTTLTHASGTPFMRCW